MTDITITSDFAFCPIKWQSNNQKHRLEHYMRWLQNSGQHWSQASLAEYRDSLLSSDYTLSTVAAYVSTVRQRYKALLVSNDLRDYLYSRTPQNAAPSDRKAIVDEAFTRISNNVDARNSTVKTHVKQDYSDQERRWLTDNERDYLLAAPGTDTLRGIRDTAMLTVFVYTGVREAELAAIKVDELNRTLEGHHALQVTSGKGRKQRLVIYGDYIHELVPAVDMWLDNAGIDDGPLFRAIDRHGTVGKSKLTTRSIQRMLKRYPLADGHEVRPHDLRRTYAQMLYDNGMDILKIREQLGHSSIETTQGYLKTGSAQGRVPRKTQMP